MREARGTSCFWAGAARRSLSRPRRRPTYDAWNRLVKVQDDDGGEPDDTIAEYRYDGLHRRIAKIVPYGKPGEMRQ